MARAGTGKHGPLIAGATQEDGMSGKTGTGKRVATKEGVKPDDPPRRHGATRDASEPDARPSRTQEDRTGKDAAYSC